MNQTPDRGILDDVWLIRLWANRTSQAGPPTDVIGPFTEAECRQVAAKLTVASDRIRFDRRIPEWARDAYP